MMRAVTRSVEETRGLGAAIAEISQRNDVLLLTGDLGAGKTSFVQGLGAALGVRDRITSPSFTLAREYQGRLKLNHLDVYRLEQIDEVIDLGLPELIDEESVTVIEWGDAIVSALPPDYLEIRILLGNSDDDRVFELNMVGSRWSARSRVLQAALEPFAGEAGAGAC